MIKNDKKERFLIYLMVLCLMTTFTFQCKPEIEEKFISSSDQLTLIQRFELEEHFSMFRELIESAGYQNALNALNPYGNKYTVFAPNNQAIKDYINRSPDYQSIGDLISDNEFVEELIKFHVVNSQFKTLDFTLGALSDSTLSGEWLLIGFSSDLSSSEVIYYVNNESSIVTQNIECSNGYIHEIDAVLTPIVHSSYEALQKMDEFSIFYEGLTKTGLNDRMSLYKTLSNGEIVRNRFTLLLEPDSVFTKYGINSLEDLALYLESDLDYSNSLNGVNNYFRYHIIEEAFYLSDFKTGLYPTFGISPVNFIVGEEIQINPGSTSFDTLFINNDTIVKDWIDIHMEVSNIPSKNGAMHVISDPLYLYFPNPQKVTLNFTEDPGFSAVKNEEGYHSFVDPEDLEYWDWTGAAALQYIKLSESPYNGNNAIQINGFFKLEYITPKILSGQYDIYTNNDGYSSRNAMVQFYLDGNRVGSPVDLTVGGKSASKPMAYTYLGYISFDEYSSHSIRVEAISNGTFTWDYIRFNPVSK